MSVKEDEEEEKEEEKERGEREGEYTYKGQRIVTKVLVKVLKISLLHEFSYSLFR